MTTLAHCDREISTLDIAVRLLMGTYTPMLAEHRRALERHRQSVLDDYHTQGEPDGHLWEYVEHRVRDGVVWAEYCCRACGETCEQLIARVRVR